MTQSETKACKNCQAEFRIEPEDFKFYEKIKVPPPTWCPLCRAQLRLSFRNERIFYKRACDRCKKDGISMYSPNKPYTVWCYDCWMSDDWDARDYAKDYDPDRSFIEQFNELWEEVPKIALIHVRSVNSEYINISADNKDCYMIIESSNNEGCVHCYWIQQCIDCVDTSFAHKTELSYESDDCYNSYKLFYSKGCHDSQESYFCYDCRGCSDCIGCVNLRNKKYHVFNRPMSKEEYKKFLQEARLDTYDGVEKVRSEFEEFLKTQPIKFAEAVKTYNSSGNYMKNTKNCNHCFHCYDAEDCKYGVHIWRNAKDCMDGDTVGMNAQLIYNSMNSAIDASNYICCSLCWTNTFMQYCYYCFNSNNCFGSVGLRKKNFFILNKEYDKEEYEKMKSKIIEDMKTRGEYGEFFPPHVSTFGYNESAAQEQFPLTKEEATAKGFKWEDHPRGTYEKETISWNDVPDSINDIKDIDVLKEIFACMECKKNFRIIPREFEFYKKLTIPLPRLCPECRHSRRFKRRGPNELWHRKCQCAGEKSDNKLYKNTVEHSHHGKGHCPNEFETSFASDREEIVYCEACYQAEVV